MRGAFHRVGKDTIGGEWGAETAIPGGRFQPFEFGAAYWSPSTGAVTVEGPVWERYAQMGTHASVLGRPLTDTQQGTARYATRTRDALATRGGEQSLMTRFEHGVIAWAEHTGAHEVVGRVAAHWLVLGGPASVVGLPTGPPTETAHGYRHGFEFGEVFERYDGTVAEVHGGILERYDKLGLWDGALGAPMTDETAVLAADGTDTGIRTNRFEHGAIFWTAALGAHELLDPWHAAYLEDGWTGRTARDSRPRRCAAPAAWAWSTSSSSTASWCGRPRWLPGWSTPSRWCSPRPPRRRSTTGTSWTGTASVPTARPS